MLPPPPPVVVAAAAGLFRLVVAGTCPPEVKLALTLDELPLGSTMKLVGCPIIVGVVVVTFPLEVVTPVVDVSKLSSGWTVKVVDDPIMVAVVLIGMLPPAARPALLANSCSPMMGIPGNW